ncbi:hypothetical protein V6N11_055630 [Hibiscus sabdariffa]|uniref:Uncharacterized protein n=2 Tax=Hibiscus sabdariffa TaxID=183260 RepID=A0ABR1ZHY3_9ROSI
MQDARSSWKRRAFTAIKVAESSLPPVDGEVLHGRKGRAESHGAAGYLSVMRSCMVGTTSGGQSHVKVALSSRPPVIGEVLHGRDASSAQFM